MLQIASRAWQQSGERSSFIRRPHGVGEVALLLAMKEFSHVGKVLDLDGRAVRLTSTRQGS